MYQPFKLLLDKNDDSPGESGSLGFLANTLSSLQWEDSEDLPVMNIVPLTWKAMLHVFDESDRHLTKVKTYARVLEDFFGQEVG